MKNIVLASKSPRRKELLAKCEVTFSCDPADIDETLNSDLSLIEAVKELSFKKASSVLQRHNNCIVIGSDTIVTIDNIVLGKPKDEAEAFQMLSGLQGHTHQVITGIAVVSNKKIYLDAVISDVTFGSMSSDEILHYISTGECMDKAGAYGIQGYGGRYITDIKGDYYAIMGLPLNKVYEELKHIEEY